MEGLVGVLEERRTDLGSDAAARVRAAFEGLDLHPRIAAVCADLYRDGHYRNAVHDASLALVNFVKEKSGRHDLDGANLIRTAFSANAPIVAFNDLTDQTDHDEQEGLMHLFEGAVLALRNTQVPSASLRDGLTNAHALVRVALLDARQHARLGIAVRLLGEVEAGAGSTPLADEARRLRGRLADLVASQR